MRILIALSNQLLCEGIKRLLCEIVPEVTLAETSKNPSGLEVDIVLFDSRKNIRPLTDLYPRAKFVLIDTGLKDLDLACLVLCHHISGIIPQEADLESFRKALRKIQAGDIWIGQKQLKTLIKNGLSLPDGKSLKGLSDQDKRIVDFIGQGCKNAEIAQKLCLSEPTIKAHLSRIYKTLNVKNRAQLACLRRDSDMVDS